MSSIIPWNSDRFVIKQYLDTNAVYIYDQISKVAYVNQSETARLVEAAQSSISNIVKRTPKSLQSILSKALTISSITNPNGGKNFECFDDKQFSAILYYYAHYAKGCEERLEAKKLVFTVMEAGSMVFILHQAGIKLSPIIEAGFQIQQIDAEDWLSSRLAGTPYRKSFTDALYQSWQLNNYHWTVIEGLNKSQFFAKWTNYVYALLFGTNADGLRKVDFCPENRTMIIGRNHLTSHKFLNAVATVEKYVGDNYHPTEYNNLKKLIFEGSLIAVPQFQLPKAPSFLKQLPRLADMESSRPNILMPANDGETSESSIVFDNIEDYLYYKLISD
jgi:hypothetical protein